MIEEMIFDLPDTRASKLANALVKDSVLELTGNMKKRKGGSNNETG
jgi:hypothetical protein